MLQGICQLVQDCCAFFFALEEPCHLYEGEVQCLVEQFVCFILAEVVIADIFFLRVILLVSLLYLFHIIGINIYTDKVPETYPYTQKVYG